MLAGALLVPAAAARATAPTIAQLDAAQRAAGNRLDVATAVGRAIFATMWPAQVSQVSANQIGPHLVIGIRLWGVKFHHPLSRTEFVAEVARLVETAFAAAPKAEEVDVWASVPLEVGKDVVVNGDLAKPTSKTVFSLSVRRGEAADAMTRRAVRSQGVFWDAAWANAAFKNQLAGGF